LRLGLSQIALPRHALPGDQMIVEAHDIANNFQGPDGKTVHS
jgi:hypothetical protein